MKANARLKLYSTLLQSTVQYAATPGEPVSTWSLDIAHVGLRDATWLADLVKSAYFDSDVSVLQPLHELLLALATDITIMARPICEKGRESGDDKAVEMLVRRDHCLQKLRQIEEGEGIP